MIKSRMIVLALFLWASVSVSVAQSPLEKKQPSPTPAKESGDGEKSEMIVFLTSGASVPPIFLNALQPVELPQGKGSWVIQVVTRGGFSGSGKGDLIVTSKGNVLCNPSKESCHKTVPRDVLESLTQMVASAKTDDIGESSLSTCRDCYATLLALYRREPDGVERKYIVYWDDVTSANVPKGIRQVYESVIRIAEEEK